MRTRPKRALGMRVVLVALPLILTSALALSGCWATGNTGTADNSASSGNTSRNTPSPSSSPSTPTQAPAGAGEVAREPATPEGNDILIPLADINETARFYPTSTSGVTVEVLAIRASDGTVRVALNTCQVCYDSGYGYYVQEGSDLVCQNCYNHFPADRVQIDVGGCNPVPIFEDMRTDDGTNITIPADLIAASAGYFAHWK